MIQISLKNSKHNYFLDDFKPFLMNKWDILIFSFGEYNDLKVSVLKVSLILVRGGQLQTLS